jgi:hypothetical protein
VIPSTVVLPTDESDLQDEKHDKPRISILLGITIV